MRKGTHHNDIILVYDSLKPGKVIYSGQCRTICDFLGVTETAIYKYFNENNDIIVGYSLRIAAEGGEYDFYKKKKYPYTTMASYRKHLRNGLKQTEREIYNHRDYSIMKGRANRYRDASSVRFTPL